MLYYTNIMENIDKSSVFWNHMSEEEKKLFLEITNNAQNIQDNESNNIAEEDKTKEIIEKDYKFVKKNKNKEIR